MIRVFALAFAVPEKNRGTPLVHLIIRLICTCMLPLLLVALWLAHQSVRSAQADRDLVAANLVQGVVASVDAQLNARIAALQVLSASPLIDHGPRREEFYREALGFVQTFGNHVILSDVAHPLRMLFNTRVPFGTELPLLPQPKGNAAAPTAIDTGRPAVGDSFIGPIARQRLVAIAVPVLQDGKATFLLVALYEPLHFQVLLDRVNLPPGWSLTLTDGEGEVLAKRSDAAFSPGAEPSRFTAMSGVSAWSTALEIPRELYRAPIRSTGATLAIGLLCAAVISLVGAVIVGRRISRAVGSLVQAPIAATGEAEIREIADARRRLLDAESRRAQADVVLRESEEKLRLFIEHAPVALAMFDRDMRYVAVSRRWMADYRLAGDVLGKSHYDIFPEIGREWREAHRRGLSGGIVRREEEAFVRADGSTQWLRWEVRPWYAADGSIGGIVIFTEDVTERKLAQEAVRRYELLAEHGRDIILFVRFEDGLILEANTAAVRAYGYDRGELTHLTIHDLREPETRASVGGQMAAAQPGGIRFETVHRRKDGTTFPVEVTAQGVSIGAARVLISIIRDITERKRAEGDLRSSRELLARSQEVGHAGSWMFDLVENRLTWSDETYRIFGLTPQESPVTYEAFLDHVHPDDRAGVDESYSSSVRTGRGGYEIEHRIIRGGAREIRFVYEKCIHERNTDGAVIRSIGIVQDITERKHAEEALRVSEERYRSVVESAFDWIWEVDAHARYTYVSPLVKELLGYEVEEVLGKTPFDFMAPGEAERVSKLFAEIVDARKPFKSLENACRHRDGRTVVVETSGAPVFNAAGELVGWRGLDRDVNDRKQAQEDKRRVEDQLRQAQKMEAIGTLAGGIAHDFNNLLGVIMGNAELLSMRDEPATELSANLDPILAASRRAKQLVSQILTFSRQGDQEKLLINLKTIVKETLEFLRASLPTTIQLRHYLGPDAGPVMADPTQMQQILMNLCTNAAHAMEERGGVLKIVLSNAPLDEASAGRVRLEPGSYVRMSVSDTGHGMSAFTRERIFDPYFTTKAPGKGTGLGLAVVHGIVKSHGGAIDLETELGKGTTFHVFLPCATAAETPATASVQTLPRGTERILLIDDDQALAGICKQMLSFLGYTVELYSHPLEALERFYETPEAFDAVISDMTMPHMTGLSLSRKIIAIRPEIPIVICTGFSDLINEESAAQAGIKALLYKPVLLPNLAQAVRAAIDGEATGPEPEADRA